MKLSTTLGMASLLLAVTVPAAAQAPKVSGLVQVWYTQMLDHNLRLNSAAPGGYYNLRSEFKENGFNVRRAELKFSGKVLDGIDWEAMIDPSINTSATNPTILQDLAIHYKTGALDFKLGQFKTLQTYEGNISSSELLFAERSMLGRVFGDKRDRGGVAGYTFGDPKDLGGKFSLGVFNGVSDAFAGKSGDANAQKDIVARLEFNLGTAQKFGAYTLQGSTDQADKGGATMVARTFAGPSAPSATAILANKDKTSNLGAFYVYQDSTWHFSAEYLTGLLGRRFASVAATTGAASREHLDQKFMGYYLTAGYTTGQHGFRVRFDQLNYNSGTDYYTASNPYTSATTDYSPKFTETTLGYTFAFKPEVVKTANLKLNYILRSKNFLKPNAASGQVSEQGGNTLVAAFQIAF